MVNHRLPFSLLPLAAAIAVSPVLAQDERAVVGVTLAARGSVQALDLLDQDLRALARRSDVYGADAVVTGEGSQTQIRMVDDSVLSLRANSELVIAEYEFDEGTEEGRAVMELVSGGIRTLTGRISPESDESDYELRTAVGSIGIRGTHYEVVQADNEVFMAVWDGEIEVNVTSGEQPSSMVLGPDSDYSYASIDGDGNVSYYLEPPEIFSAGYADEDEPEEEESADEDAEVAEEDIDDEAGVDEDGDAGNEDDEQPDDGEEQDEETTVGGDAALAAGEGEEEDETIQLSPDVLVTISAPPPETEPDLASIGLATVPTPPSVIAQRTGTATYSNLLSMELEGTRTDYDVTLQFGVNFTLGTVDGGHLELLSAQDGDRWFATFEGGIIGNELSLGPVIGENRFNYAEHNGQEAQGHLNGQFFGSTGSQVQGDFRLEQVANPDVFVSGDYVVGESN